jgi:O-antigen/teichoic acid export membrane protein
MTDIPSASPSTELGDVLYEPTPDLSSKVARGLKWKVVTQVVSEGSRAVVAVVLAHLLTPSQYGIVGMAFVVAGFVSLVANPWLGAAIVQRARITEADRSTIFWMAVGVGGLATALSFALSTYVADFFGQPQVRWLFAVIAVGFVVEALGTTHAALLERELAFRSMELRGIAGTLVGAVVAVSLAFAGAGPWAVVGNSLAADVTSTVLLWLLLEWRPKFLFSVPIFRSVGGYTLNLLGSRILGYTNVSADNFLIGRFLGAAPLGTYAVAYNVMFTPMLRVAHPLQDVLFPAFANLQHLDDRLQAAWLRSKQLAAAVLSPLFLTTFAVAPDFVSVVLGSRWDGAIPVLRILCIAGVAYSLGTLNWSLLMGLGKGKMLFQLNVVVTTVTVAAYGLGLIWGIVGVAVSGAVVRWLLVVPESWLATRAAGVDFLATLKATLSPLPFAFAATGLAVLARAGLVSIHVPAFLRLGLVALLLLAVYAALLYAFLPRVRVELRAVGRRLMHRRTSTASA